MRVLFDVTILPCQNFADQVFGWRPVPKDGYGDELPFLASRAYSEFDGLAFDGQSHSACLPADDDLILFLARSTEYSKMPDAHKSPRQYVHGKSVDKRFFRKCLYSRFTTLPVVLHAEAYRISFHIGDPVVADSNFAQD